VRGSAALNGVKFKIIGKRDRRLSFDKSSPALPDRESPRFPVTESEQIIAGHALRQWGRL